MNERRSPHHSQPVVVCQNFLGLWLLKHWKIRIAYRHWLSKFRWSGRKTKIRRKKPKVTNSATLIMAFLAAENENRQLEDLPQAAFGCVPERHLLLVRTESITENFVYWKLRPLLNLWWFNAFSHLEPWRKWGLSGFLFSFVDFSCHWRAIVFIW